MARVIVELHDNGRSYGISHYVQFLDGKLWSLDIHDGRLGPLKHLGSLKSTLYTEARRLGLRIEVHIVGKRLEVQAIGVDAKMVEDMARRRKEWIAQRRNRVKQSHYKRFFNGQVWSLDLTDAAVGAKTMVGLRVGVTNAAKRLGIRVRTQIFEGRLEVQALLDPVEIVRKSPTEELNDEIERHAPSS